MRTSPKRLLVIVLAFLLVGCAERQLKPLQPGVNAFPQPHGYDAYSVDDDIKIGQQAKAEVEKQLPVLSPSDPLSTYVNTLGQRLAAQLPEPRFPYEYHVINQKEINAFALPGGPIYVNVGTIQAADNEAELAGVLAHETAHVYMRHSTHSASKEQMISLPAAILGAVLGQGVGGQLARLGMQFGLGSLFLKYSRDQESEADYVGSKIMYEAGYDPHEMVRFFEKLKEESGNGGPQFLTDHPNPGNRAEAVNQEISQLPTKTWRVNSPQFQQAKAEVAKMHPLTAQQIAERQKAQRPNLSSVSANAVAPSGGFRQYNDQIFSIAVPSNWTVMGGQRAVAIGPQAGMQQGQIAYGVIVSAYQPRQPGESLAQAMSELYSLMRAQNPNIQQGGQLAPITVNGVQGAQVKLVSPSPLVDQSGQPAEETDQLVAVPRPDGTLLYLVFIAPSRDFPQLAPTYEQMLRTLQVR
jgi:Zn-dependent protease with chaperone function